MTVLAVLAVTVTIGGWLGIRAAEATHRINRDLTAFLLTTCPPADIEDFDEWESEVNR